MWGTVINQTFRWILDKYGAELGIVLEKDWKYLDIDSFKKTIRIGFTMFSRNRITIYELLQTHYPELRWGRETWLRMPPFHWGSQETQRFFLDECGKYLDIKTSKDWQMVEFKTMLNFGAKSLLDMYGNLYDTLLSIYPEFNLDPFHQLIIPRTVWTAPIYKERVVNAIRDSLCIKEPRDWYRLSANQIANVLGREVGSKKLMKMLQFVFPDERWNTVGFSNKNKKSRQRWLLLKIKELYQNEIIMEEYRPSQIRRVSGVSIELDIYLPTRKLAFEFHGEQHYGDLPKAGFTSWNSRRYKDQEKFELCEANEIKLIIVPYWWDNQMESLKRLFDGYYAQDLPMETTYDLFRGFRAKQNREKNPPSKCTKVLI
eukprot:TRINITY_DN17716_c0_g1_i1.p1 TRINITY_DN17716_c0_g1~~TRINITY_DN17716_c0_g1_i1.p1  ORF type:complete len:389 (-),score=91.79 TRINITY_DN17716_c0_g1_i1:11-1126(-)